MQIKFKFKKKKKKGRLRFRLAHRPIRILDCPKPPLTHYVGRLPDREAKQIMREQAVLKTELRPGCHGGKQTVGETSRKQAVMVRNPAGVGGIKKTVPRRAPTHTGPIRETEMKPYLGLRVI